MSTRRGPRESRHAPANARRRCSRPRAVYTSRSRHSPSLRMAQLALADRSHRQSSVRRRGGLWRDSNAKHLFDFVVTVASLQTLIVTNFPFHYLGTMWPLFAACLIWCKCIRNNTYILQFPFIAAVTHMNPKRLYFDFIGLWSRGDVSCCLASAMTYISAIQISFDSVISYRRWDYMHWPALSPHAPISRLSRHAPCSASQRLGWYLKW